MDEAARKEKEKEYYRLYHEANKEKRNERSRLYREANKEKLNERSRVYQQENKEKEKERSRVYGQENKEKISERMKVYYQENKESLREHKKVYYQENKEQSRVYRRDNKEKIAAHHKERWNSDVGYRMGGTLRTRIGQALNGKSKSARTITLIGCTINELKAHLESKFTDGMNWDNWSFYGWHIDHHQPCASFDLTDTEQQKLCFHFTNLQPLWAKDNLSKGAKILAPVNIPTNQ